jgi:type II secretory pathway pseudopilin PulG
MNTKGFTLIEMLLYIGLFGMLMGTLSVSAFVFIASMTALEHRAAADESRMVSHFNEYEK